MSIFSPSFVLQVPVWMVCHALMIDVPYDRYWGKLIQHVQSQDLCTPVFHFGAVGPLL